MSFPKAPDKPLQKIDKFDTPFVKHNAQKEELLKNLREANDGEEIKPQERSPQKPLQRDNVPYYKQVGDKLVKVSDNAATVAPKVQSVNTGPTSKLSDREKMKAAWTGVASKPSAPPGKPTQTSMPGAIPRPGQNMQANQGVTVTVLATGEKKQVNPANLHERMYKGPNDVQVRVDKTGQIAYCNRDRLQSSSTTQQTDRFGRPLMRTGYDLGQNNPNVWHSNYTQPYNTDYTSLNNKFADYEKKNKEEIENLKKQLEEEKKKAKEDSKVTEGKSALKTEADFPIFETVKWLCYGKDISRYDKNVMDELFKQFRTWYTQNVSECHEFIENWKTVSDAADYLTNTWKYPAHIFTEPYFYKEMKDRNPWWLAIQEDYMKAQAQILDVIAAWERWMKNFKPENLTSKPDDFDNKVQKTREEHAKAMDALRKSREFIDKHFTDIETRQGVTDSVLTWIREYDNAIFDIKQLVDEHKYTAALKQIQQIRNKKTIRPPAVNPSNPAYAALAKMSQDLETKIYQALDELEKQVVENSNDFFVAQQRSFEDMKEVYANQLRGFLQKCENAAKTFISSINLGDFTKHINTIYDEEKKNINLELQKVRHASDTISVQSTMNLKTLSGRIRDVHDTITNDIREYTDMYGRYKQQYNNALHIEDATEKTAALNKLSKDIQATLKNSLRPEVTGDPKLGKKVEKSYFTGFRRHLSQKLGDKVLDELKKMWPDEATHKALTREQQDIVNQFASKINYGTRLKDVEKDLQEAVYGADDPAYQSRLYKLLQEVRAKNSQKLEKLKENFFREVEENVKGDYIKMFQTQNNLIEQTREALANDKNKYYTEEYINKIFNDAIQYLEDKKATGSEDFRQAAEQMILIFSGQKQDALREVRSRGEVLKKQARKELEKSDFMKRIDIELKNFQQMMGYAEKRLDEHTFVPDVVVTDDGDVLDYDDWKKQYEHERFGGNKLTDDGEAHKLYAWYKYFRNERNWPEPGNDQFENAFYKKFCRGMSEKFSEIIKQEFRDYFPTITKDRSPSEKDAIKDVYTEVLNEKLGEIRRYNEDIKHIDKALLADSSDIMDLIDRVKEKCAATISPNLAQKYINILEQAIAKHKQELQANGLGSTEETNKKKTQNTIEEFDAEVAARFPDMHNIVHIKTENLNKLGDKFVDKPFPFLDVFINAYSHLQWPMNTETLRQDKHNINKYTERTEVWAQPTFYGKLRVLKSEFASNMEISAIIEEFAKDYVTNEYSYVQNAYLLQDMNSIVSACINNNLKYFQKLGSIYTQILMMDDTIQPLEQDMAQKRNMSVQHYINYKRQLDDKVKSLHSKQSQLETLFRQVGCTIEFEERKLLFHSWFDKYETEFAIPNNENCLSQMSSYVNANINAIVQEQQDAKSDRQATEKALRKLYKLLSETVTNLSLLLPHDNKKREELTTEYKADIENVINVLQEKRTDNEVEAEVQYIEEYTSKYLDEKMSGDNYRLWVSNVVSLIARIDALLKNEKYTNYNSKLIECKTKLETKQKDYTEYVDYEKEFLQGVYANFENEYNDTVERKLDDPTEKDINLIISNLEEKAKQVIHWTKTTVASKNTRIHELQKKVKAKVYNLKNSAKVTTLRGILQDNGKSLEATVIAMCRKCIFDVEEAKKMQPTPSSLKDFKYNFHAVEKPNTDPEKIVQFILWVGEYKDPKYKNVLSSERVKDYVEYVERSIIASFPSVYIAYMEYKNQDQKNFEIIKTNTNSIKDTLQKAYNMMEQQHGDKDLAIPVTLALITAFIAPVMKDLTIPWERLWAIVPDPIKSSHKAAYTSMVKHWESFRTKGHIHKFDSDTVQDLPTVVAMQPLASLAEIPLRNMQVGDALFKERVLLSNIIEQGLFRQNIMTDSSCTTTTEYEYLVSAYRILDKCQSEGKIPEVGDFKECFDLYTKLKIEEEHNQEIREIYGMYNFIMMQSVIGCIQGLCYILQKPSLPPYDTKYIPDFTEYLETKTLTGISYQTVGHNSLNQEASQSNRVIAALTTAFCFLKSYLMKKYIINISTIADIRHAFDKTIKGHNYKHFHSFLTQAKNLR